MDEKANEALEEIGQELPHEKDDGVTIEPESSQVLSRSIDINNVVIQGRMVRAVDCRSTPSGAAVLTFTLGNHGRRGANQTTRWVQVTAFGRTAEIIAKYGGKGKEVIIVGYLDHVDQKRRVTCEKCKEPALIPVTVTRVVAQQVRFIGRK